MTIDLSDLALVTLASFACAGILFKALAVFGSRRQSDALPASDVVSGPVFLFRAEALIDATHDAIEMLSQHRRKMTDYEAALHVLKPHFPELEQKLEQHTEGQLIIPHRSDGPLYLVITRDDQSLRLAIKSSADNIAGNTTRIIENDVMLSELAMLRELTQHTPQLIWQESRDGKLIWANHAYLEFSDKLTDPNAGIPRTTWPKTSVFPDLHECLGNGGSSPRRISAMTPNAESEHWFDVTSISRDGGFLHFATNANAAVRAEQERRNFVQTLGKTFAQLSIGLAIFDKRRELAMFNPALLELTRLPAEFLSSRPTIDTVLDRLREARVLPEPKNYASWREQFTTLEAQAKDGTYCKVWNLPDGQAYRVTGRPHPDGAFAILFEDISAEVSLTRRFRSDVETGQAVLDTLSDAIAVFSSSGTLVMSNRAYAELWSTDQTTCLSQRELRSEIQMWQHRCTPTKMWSELLKFTHLSGNRTAWSDNAILDDGRNISCHANPIAGGMTMIRFAFAAPMTPVIRKLTMQDPAIRNVQR